MNDLTNFPSGLSSRGVPVLGGSRYPTTGKVFFVGATATHSDMVAGVDNSSTNGLSPLTPFATVAYAISQCTANNNDVIYALPGHTETISAAAGWTPKAGSSIIALGQGSNRPTLTFSATASTVVMSAANVTIENFLVKPGIADVVVCFPVTGNWVTLRGIDVIPNGTNSIKSFATVGAAASWFLLDGGFHVATTAAGAAASWIQITGHASTSTGIRIRNWSAFLTVAAGASSGLEVNTTATVAMFMENCRMVVLGNGSAVPVTLIGSSGFIAQNYISGSHTTLTSGFVTTGVYGSQNYVSNSPNTNGAVVPGVDS